MTTSGTPYFVTPNQIIVTDISGFRLMKRAMMDVTGWISSVLPEVPVLDKSSMAGADAFAAIESTPPRFNDAFAQFPSALPYASEPAFTGGAVTDANGNAIWAKVFGGRRDQGTDDHVIASVTKGWGGAIGFHGDVTASTRLGAFVGGSNNDTVFALNAGSLDIGAVFGGVYSRTLFGNSFLDLAVIGGTLDNESKRNMNGAAETASATYDGWFVTPMLALGHRIVLQDNLTLTPAVTLRYVAAHFDGYTESGSTANLTVANQNFQGLEERAQVTLASVSRWDGYRVIVRGHAGVMARQYGGDGTVNVAVLGQSVIADIAERSVLGLYGGGGVDWQFGRIVLLGAGEFTAMNDNSVVFAGKGGLRAVW